MLSNSLLGHQDERSPAQASAPATVTTNTAKPQSAFRSYLAPETPTAVTSVGDQAAKRTWKIEIFQGDQREVQEIDWPEEPVTKAKPTSNTSGNPVLKLFNRREKAETPNAVETKSTSLVRRQPGTQPTDSTEEKNTESSAEGTDKK